MISDEALRRYRFGQFTDDDVTRSTGVSVRAWRELINIRAVRTETKKVGRGYIRLCDHVVLKRTALIGALNRTGLSLAVSGHIAYSLPFHTLLYEICDPCAILLDRSAALNARTGLPPRVEAPLVDWFSSDKPAETDPKNDWLLTIYERRFVGVIYSSDAEPIIFGDLRNNGTTFVAWWPHGRRTPPLGDLIERFIANSRLLAAVAAWENPTQWAKELNSLGYKYEKHNEDDDPLCAAARERTRNSVFTTNINVTLTVRKALRRVLGVEPACQF